MNYKVYLLVAVLTLFLMAGHCRADTILDVNASVEFAEGPPGELDILDTANISMQLDETNLTVVPGTATLVFTGGLAGTTFTMSGSFYSSPTDALFNFTDAEGDLVQFGDDDYSCAFNAGVCPLFPAAGSYPGFLVEAFCNNEIGPTVCEADLLSIPFPARGTVTVIPAPEPETAFLLAPGLLFLLSIRRKYTLKFH
jgi:hypothetical protein